jgi:hypothetical protein
LGPINPRQVKNNIGGSQGLLKLFRRAIQIILMHNHLRLPPQRRAQILADKPLRPGH